MVRLASADPLPRWALVADLVATALFRWPVASGQFADQTVTTTLGSVVDGLGGDTSGADPGVTVASHVHESLFYQAWLAGTLGSTDSATAREYGPELFKAHALNWHEAEIVQNDPHRGAQIIEEKKERVVLIKGDTDANYSAIMEDMDDLVAAGIEDIGLITEPKHRPGETQGGK